MLKQKMMEKMRTKFALVKQVLLLTFLLAAMLLQSCGSKQSTMQGDDNDFRISSAASVTKIFLADRQNQTADLERQSDGTWTLNGKYKARPDAIELLLKTMSEVRVRYSVDGGAKASVDKMLAQVGIKVQVYEGGSSPSKTFYVGTGTADQLGTYMYMEGAEKAYITHIANWEGILTPRFLTNLEDWRDRTIFATPSEKIAQATVEYSGSQSVSSFVCNADGGKYTVKPALSSTIAIEKPLVEGQVKAFLTGFERIIAEGWETKNEKKDSVLHTAPFCTITLKTTNNVTHTVALYPIPGRLTDDNNAGLIARAPVERYYVWLDKTDFLLGQHGNFKRLLWAYPSFFDQPVPQPEGKRMKRKY
jgi:hypothetical protein